VMVGRRVPILDSYMPRTARAAGGVESSSFDPAREQEVQLQLERHSRRKASRKGRDESLVSLFSLSPRRGGEEEEEVPRRPRSLLERTRRWEAEREVCASELEYWRARATYCEDAVRIMQEEVERPLRRFLRDASQRAESLQQQLNVVAAQADERAHALANAESRIHAEAEGRRQDAEEMRQSRESLAKIEAMIERGQETGDTKIEQLSARLSRVLNISADLESRVLPTSPRSPNSDSPPPPSLRKLSTELQELQEKRKKELKERDTLIADLQSRLALNAATPLAAGDADGLGAVWELLWELLHDTDRQRAGLRTALAQMQLKGNSELPAHRPKAAGLHELKKGDFGALPAEERVSRLRALTEAITHEAGLERADAVAAVRRVLVEQQKILASRAEQEQALIQRHSIDQQRLSEVERDREEERVLYQTERERLQQISASFEAGAKSKGPERATQTEVEQADSWAQTQGTQTDEFTRADQRVISEKEGLREALRELNRAIDQRDARIRKLEEHRGRFMSFVYSSGADAHGSVRNLHANDEKRVTSAESSRSIRTTTM